MSHIAEKWKEFCEWQKQPHQVTQKSPELHRCLTCGEEYQGNYCPRCGQSAKIERYSLKNSLLLCFTARAEMVYNSLSFLLIVIPVRQLSGYSYPNSVWRVPLAAVVFVLMIALMIISVLLAILIHAGYISWHF